MTLEEIVSVIKSAHDSHTPLRIRGAGSKDFYGGMLAGFHCHRAAAPTAAIDRA